MICALLFYATTVNYMDRQVLGLLKPILAKDLGWGESDFGWMVFFFQASYALMMPVAGRIIDALGTRIGYAMAALVWGLASMSHSLATTSTQFKLARFALGVGESANFPAAIKTVADWFPRKERALAAGIFNSGSNLGALIAPLFVPLVTATLGWRSVFLVTGGLDLIWAVVWLIMFRQPRHHKLVSPEELALIESDRETDDAPRRVPYSALLDRRATWAFLLGKFFTDPVWWFYLYWLPGFLNKNHGLNLSRMGPALVAIYLSADVGSIGGGWLSGHFLKRGWPVARARKTALLVSALAVIPVSLIHFTGGKLWLTVALISLAAAAHQGWSANLYTIVSDIFPRSAVGSVVGLGGMGGAIGGLLAAPVIGYWLQFTHSWYAPLFIAAGLAYIAILCIIHLLLPRFVPVDVQPGNLSGLVRAPRSTGD